MKTSNFLVYGAPVALLLMAGGLAAPGASAQTVTTTQTVRNIETVQARFTFDRTAPAERIHADLRNAAERLCVRPGPRPAYLRKHDNACVESAVADAVARIDRTDLAQFHGRLGG